MASTVRNLFLTLVTLFGGAVLGAIAGSALTFFLVVNAGMEQTRWASRGDRAQRPESPFDDWTHSSEFTLVTKLTEQFGDRLRVGTDGGFTGLGGPDQYLLHDEHQLETKELSAADLTAAIRDIVYQQIHDAGWEQSTQPPGISTSRWLDSIEHDYRRGGARGHLGVFLVRNADDKYTLLMTAHEVR